MGKIKNWSKIGDNEWFNKKLKIWLRIEGSGSFYKPEPPYYVEIKYGKQDKWKLLGRSIRKGTAISEAVLYMKKRVR